MVSKIDYLVRVSSAIDSFTQRLGNIAAWFVSFLVLLVGVIVVLRYGFSFGSIALQESILYVNAVIFIFGASYTLKTGGHVRVDVFYSRIGEKGKSFINALGALLFLMPAMILIIFTSEDYVMMSWKIFERSPESSGLPFVYLLKTLILVMAVLLSLQGLSELFKSCRALVVLSSAQSKADTGK